MNTPPPGLADEVLLALLAERWAFDAASLDYVARGFGSHHWLATGSDGDRRFLTVDDLSKVRLGGSSDASFAQLERAFTVAYRLAAAGLEFVLAPLPARDGGVLARIDAGAGFSLAVFPFVDGETNDFGEYRSDEQRAAVAGLLAELHECTAIVEGVAGADDFALPCRSALADVLRGAPASGPTGAGPYEQRACDLVRRAASTIDEALDTYDRLVDAVRTGGVPSVITHGEPHGGNVIWTDDGPRLIDWDTALIAPPGRDFWMLEPDDEAVHRAAPVDHALYRLWWDLAEIAGYVTEFREPHVESDDTAEAWRNLVRYVEQLPRTTDVTRRDR